MSSPNSLEAPGRRESPLSFPPATTGGVDQRAAAKKPGVLARLIVSPLAVRGNFKADAGYASALTPRGFPVAKRTCPPTGPGRNSPPGIITRAYPDLSTEGRREGKGGDRRGKT